MFQSPYTGQRADVVCGDKEASYILPLNLVAHYPKISSLFENWNGKIPLKDINAAVGHVIVHFLYTGTYQCLQPEESSPHEKKSVEFKTSIRAYIAARAYEIPVLAKLASMEAEILGDDLDFPTVLGVLEETYPRPPVDDAWISEYLRARINGILSQPRLFSSVDKSEQSTTSIAQICVESMMVISPDKLNPHSCVNAPPDQDQNHANRSIDSSKYTSSPTEHSVADIPDDRLGNGIDPEPDYHSEAEPLEPMEGRYPSDFSVPEEDNVYLEECPATEEAASVCADPPIAEEDCPEAEAPACVETRPTFPESPVTGVEEYPLGESSVFESEDCPSGEPSVPGTVEEPLSEEPMPAEAAILVDEGCEEPVIYDEVPETRFSINPSDGPLRAQDINHDPTLSIQDSPLCTHGLKKKRCSKCKKARKSFKESMTFN